MSFVVEYRPFLNVTVQEDGPNTLLRALTFAPTRECIGALADKRLVFRRREAGFQVFYQRNPLAADPLLSPITARVRLTFAAVLTRPDLFETFEPDLTADTGPQLYFDNLTPSGNIQTKSTLTTTTVVQSDDASRIYPPIFEATADLDVPSPPTVWRVVDRFDSTNVLHNESIDSASTGLTRTQIDLTEKALTGPFTLATDEASPPSRAIYVDEALAYLGTAAVVDLHWEARQDTVPPGGENYFIRFRRR